MDSQKAVAKHSVERSSARRRALLASLLIALGALSGARVGSIIAFHSSLYADVTDAGSPPVEARLDLLSGVEEALGALFHSEYRSSTQAQVSH